MSNESKIDKIKNALKFEQEFAGEYYFKVNKELEKVLNSQFQDIGFKGVNAIVYNPYTEELKAECFYMFNVSYCSFENEDIKLACKNFWIN